MPSSHRRREQDKTRQSCLVRVCGVKYALQIELLAGIEVQTVNK